MQYHGAQEPVVLGLQDAVDMLVVDVPKRTRDVFIAAAESVVSTSGDQGGGPSRFA